MHVQLFYTCMCTIILHMHMCRHISQLMNMKTCELCNNCTLSETPTCRHRKFEKIAMIERNHMCHCRSTYTSWTGSVSAMCYIELVLSLGLHSWYCENLWINGELVIHESVKIFMLRLLSVWIKIPCIHALAWSQLINILILILSSINQL